MKEIAHKSHVPKPGDLKRRERKPYIRRAGLRPRGEDTYQIDGQPHRFDGKCHDDCENVR